MFVTCIQLSAFHTAQYTSADSGRKDAASLHDCAYSRLRFLSDAAEAFTEYLLDSGEPRSYNSLYNQIPLGALIAEIDA